MSEGIQLAKNCWSCHLADRIHQIAQNPKDSWQTITTLKKGIQGHHKSSDIMSFSKRDGTFTETDIEYFKVLSE